jgi:hypothetical protein
VSSKRRAYLFLALISLAVLLVDGYHPGAEDGEIYLPGIKKFLNPALYPFGDEFFQNHAHLTLFPEIIAASVRASHLSFDVAVFLWYGLSTFLTLLACWRLASEAFSEAAARWSGILLVASLFTIPVAGTALYIADQYLTSRSIVTFAVLFAISEAWRGRRAAFILWSLVAFCVHPLMAVFGISYAALLWFMKRREGDLMTVAGFFPLLFGSLANIFPAPTDAYRLAVSTRPYFFIFQWQWYEWLGALAPLVVLWFIAKYCERHSIGAVNVMSRALIIYSAAYIVLTLISTTLPLLFSAARFQPMRSLHLVYILMFLFGGGLLGQLVLKRRAWRWIAVFVPLCSVMYGVQLQLFPTSPHIEWPMAAPGNDWLRCFDWIRRNTPTDAVFAIDPDYMLKDDEHGFRVIAERSRLADAVKDSGAVTMFPELPSATHWLEQLNAQKNWSHFTDNDFRRLKRTYGVSWVVLQHPMITSFVCPYENQTLSVCRLN